ncbi:MULTISPECIES: serine protease [unclassified Streptomyces]|uniref:S1 family peptidase n=1 Tax=unclassified Streptomyces TaxID=2593676 RepID=UPI002DDA9C8A|nr:serine protease [Streptomyces sp. NBC_01795]WSA95176.1 serine protease [Streptomyces sp. NBC_01795]WSS40914.1 serine protease [Streptomyces sp. NBC_01187]
MSSTHLPGPSTGPRTGPASDPRTSPPASPSGEGDGKRREELIKHSRETPGSRPAHGKTPEEITGKTRRRGGAARAAAVTALSLGLAAGVIGATGATAAYAGESTGAAKGSGDSGYETKIIGGKESTEKYPFVVSLQKERDGNPNSHACGGTLIAPDWVATAAHCVSAEKVYDPKLYHVRVGSLDRTQGGTVVGVKQFKVNPGWTYHEDRASGQDIALIQLSEKVKQKPAALAATTPAAGDTIKATGWGYTKATDNNPAQLPVKHQEIDLPVLAPDTPKCVSNPEDGDAWGIAEGDFCTDNPGGNAGTCGGDSGAAALTKAAGRWQLAGITSRSVGDCATTPDIYTSAAEQRDWIKSVIG